MINLVMNRGTYSCITIEKTININQRAQVNNSLDIDETDKLPTDSEHFHQLITKVFLDCDDFQVRVMELPSKQQVNLYYINLLIDVTLLHDWVIHPLNKRIKENNLTIVIEVPEAVQAIN